MGFIYKILNLIDGKVYIGSTNNYKRRFQEHKKNLRGNRHPNKHLQRSWNKYGEEFFSFDIIHYSDINQHLLKIEEEYIKNFNACDKRFGYNVIEIVQGRNKQSEETKEKLRQLHKGKKLSDEHRKKIKEVMNSPERMEKSRREVYDKFWTETAIKNRAEAQKRRRGKPHTGKGAKGINHHTAKTYIIVNVNTDEEILVKCLSEFCRQNNLDVQAMHRTSRNNPRYHSHKGFKVIKINDERKS